MAGLRKLSPHEQAAKTDKWTEILFRALAARVSKRWRFVSFRGAGGGEWKGVVDILAVRKDTSKSSHEMLKSGDLFDFVLVQMKGGSAKPPSAADIRRLQAVKSHYDARAIVLFFWNHKSKDKATTKFELLDSAGRWVPSSSTAIFGL